MISLLQRENITNEVALKKLKQGYSPSNKDVVDEVIKEEGSHVFGKPYYKPLQITPHSITNSTKWNKSFDNLKKDLDVLFQANVKMNNKIISHQERGNAENGLVNANINILSMKYKEIVDMINKNLSSYGFIESFKDFRYIDNGTVDVNLREKSVTLEKSNNSKRYSIEASSIKISPVTRYTSEENLGSLKSITGDFINEFNVIKYTTSVNGDFTLQMNVDLQSGIVTNAVQLSVNSSSTMSAVLYVSENGSTFDEQYEVESDGLFEWMFNDSNVKSIKIVLKKSTADGYNDGLYEHYFTFKNISLMKNVYEQEGVFVSKPIMFSGSVDKIRLNSTDILFNNTNIIYSIGMERSDKKTQWITVDNHECADLGLLTEVEEVVNRNDLNYGQSISDGLYRIYKLPRKTNADSINIRPGYQMWYKEHLEGVGGYNYNLSLLSYDASKITEKAFVDTEDYVTTLSSRELDVLTQYVDVDEDVVVTFPIAYSSESSAPFQQVMFCNGTKIAQKNGAFTMSLKKGSNKIIMFMYVGTGPTGDTYSTTATNKVNFKEITDNIFAFPKMKQINQYSLKKETLSDNYVYYSIIDDNIIVKHSPVADISNYNNEIRYYLSYRYLSEDSPYIQYKDGEPFIRVMLKALLVSRKENFTPKITSYRLSSE